MTKNAKDNTRYVRGGGSVRQRPDGRWEARCTINGKRRSFYGMKQADVLKAMRDAQAEAESKSCVEPSKMTFGEWLDIWYNEYNRPNLKQTTRETRELAIKKHIKPVIGAIKLQDLDTNTLQHFYNNLATRLAAYSIRTIIRSVISASLNQAVRCGYISTNPAAMCVLPKRVKKDIKPFTASEVSVFLKELEKEKDPTLRQLLTVLLFTGMRFGEALGLPWKAIDIERGKITIEQQLQYATHQGLYITTPKNGKPRTIYPPAIVLDTIKEVRDRQEDSRKLAGELYENSLGLVFTNPLGHPLNRSRIRVRFRQIVKQMGRPDMRIHDLRHTYAVMALKAGDDPKTVQNALGHHTAAFTLDVYAHVMEDATQGSADRMQAYYESITKTEVTAQ